MFGNRRATFFGEREAVEHAWHDDVAEHDVDRPVELLDELERVVAALRLEHMVALLPEPAHRELPHPRLVVYDEDGAPAAGGGRRFSLRAGPRCAPALVAFAVRQEEAHAGPHADLALGCGGRRPTASRSR